MRGAAARVAQILVAETRGADSVAEPPRCLDGGCVAFWTPPGKGTERNERCTRKTN